MSAKPSLKDATQVVRATAAFGVTQGCVVYVGGARPPSDADWQAYLDFLAPRLSKLRLTPRLVWDDSGGPSAVNRLKLAALTRDVPVKVAIISSTRTVAAALNWQHDRPAYHEFTPEDLKQAMAFVGIEGMAALATIQMLRTLRRRLLGHDA